MSLPQSRSDKSDNQYKKFGRSGSGSSGNHQRGSSGRGGGGPVPSTASSLSSNRSFKKTNNAQVGQPRTTVPNLNTESSNVSAPQRPLENGSHSQPPLHASDVPVAGNVAKPADSSSVQKSNQVVPKAPSSQSSTMSADKTVPTTPAKSPGDVSGQFPLQFGSISPGFMNGMQIPARTSSAPPNLDEQKRDQARHQSSRAGPVFPIPSAPKPELPRKDLITVEQSNSVEAHSPAKAKKDAHLSSTLALAQPRKPVVTPMGVQMPYHQPHGSGQFSNSNLPIQAQGMAGGASLQMPMSMQIPIGNPSQMQQQMFIPNLQPHPMQHQGLLHQAQALNFSAQLGPQIPPQLGNLVGMGMAPQYPQHIAGKYGSSTSRRTPVKITDPKTNMNVRLDQPTYGEGGAMAPKPLSNAPQSQPIPSFTPAHPVNYYPNAYNANSHFFTSPNSLPITNAQGAPSSQAARINYPVSQGPQLTSFVNPPTHNSLSTTKTVTITEMPILERAHDVHNITPSGRPTIQVSVPQAVAEKAVETSLPIKDHQKKAGNKDQSHPQTLVTGQSNSILGLPSLDVDHTISSSSGVLETVEAKSTFAPTKSSAGVETEENGSSKILEMPKKDICEKEILCEVIPTRSDKGGPQTGSDDVENVTSANDGATLKDTNKDENEHVGCQTEIEKESENQLIPRSLGSVSSESSPSALVLSTSSEVDKELISDGSSNITKDTEEVSIAKTDKEVSESTLKNEGEFADNIVSESKDRHVEPSRAKNVVSNSKKKRKELLQRADAAGTTSDLYMAYKGPDEKKDVTISSESSSTSIDLKQVATDDANQKDVDLNSKAEPEDWEEAADISTPKLESFSENDEILTKKYSRDFLLKFAEQCIDLPNGFEITSEIEPLLGTSVNISHHNDRDSHPSPRRNVDRNRPDRRGIVVDDDKWHKVPGRDLHLDIGYGGNVAGLRPGQGGNFGVLRNPRGQAGGILSGPMQSMSSQGGMQRSNPDDRWQRATGFQKGLIPSPQTPLQVMHRAERKYEIGKVSDEEQAKQRQLKAILNKLTPQNFEKLFEQVKAVNIDNAVTLTGVISQIFDKALTEPHFCEMYADFCHHLARELPDFSEDNEKITFKRLLLNKCQEEFESGEREQEEASRVEEGEVKESKEKREEKRILARRRMLGNIRLIGELYKKKMLTGKIMHSCINKLLGQNQNPDEEDIESLCKLMSTIGEMIDNPIAKDHMDAYFDIMANLSNNMKLSSRVRFMLKDTIDLRRNRWQQRRKVDGPKKIEDVHRDAAQERHAQSQIGRMGRGINPSMRRGPPVDFGPRGSTVLSTPNTQMGNYRGFSPQIRGYGNQDIRSQERQPYETRPLSVPLPQRFVGDDSLTLGPQGGLARGMSNRGPPAMSIGPNGYNAPTDHTTYGRFGPERYANPSGYEHSGAQERNMPGNRDLKNPDQSFDGPFANTPPSRVQGPTSTESNLTEEHMEKKSISTIKEFYGIRNEGEVLECIQDFKSPSFHPTMISLWVIDSFERKDMDRDLLAGLLVNIMKSRDGPFTQPHLVEGFEMVLTTLEDAVNDAPRATEFLGRIFAKTILENVVPIETIGQLIQTGGEEPGSLLRTGLAADVLASILTTIQTEKGDVGLKEIGEKSKMLWKDFRPPAPMVSNKLEKFI